MSNFSRDWAVRTVRFGNVAENGMILIAVRLGDLSKL
jgi:hypothetical protein